MKSLSMLVLAALLSTGAAFAASTATPATPSATPATAAPATASGEKHHSMQYCEKQAKEKKLTGDEEKKFVKECHASKKTS